MDLTDTVIEAAAPGDLKRVILDVVIRSCCTRCGSITVMPRGVSAQMWQRLVEVADSTRTVNVFACDHCYPSAMTPYDP
jgi:hypothetical protein